MKLRDYQTKAIEAVSQKISGGVRSVILWSPTGSGKTVIASAIVDQLISGGIPTLFLAHRKELIDQAHNKLNDIGVPHGIIMAGHPTDSTAPVQIASVQTLIRRKCPVKPGMIIVDECHHASADSYRKIIDQFPEAFLLGLTATPFRTDGKGLGDLFQEWILVDSVPSLTQKGFLVPARYWSASIPDLRGVKKKGGDWDPESLAERLGRPKLVGDIIDHYLLIGRGKRFICFCVNQKHSREMAEAFSVKGILTAHLGDDTPKRERENTLAAHVAGEISGITNVNILSEGYDSPMVSVCILARPTLSLGMHLQQIGRVLRPAIGKDCAYILDHAGNCRRHGLADDEIEVDLKKGTVQRTEGDSAPALRTCAQCYAILPSSVQICPLCGAVLGQPPKTIITADGTLQELTKPICDCGGFETTKKPHPIHGTGLYCSKCGKWIRWIGKQLAPVDFLRDRIQLCKVKKFKPGWAYVQFQVRFGRWPDNYEKEEAGQKEETLGN